MISAGISWMRPRLQAVLRLPPALAAVLLVAVIAGCSHPDSIIGKSEDQYGLGVVPVVGSNLRIYHSALLNPAGIHLDSEGYVIGIEKIHGLLGERQVTHVIQYGGTGQYSGTDSAVASRGGQKSPRPCILFSSFSAAKPAAEVANEPMSNCPSRKPSDGYLEGLRTSLSERLTKGHFSHIFVMVMGWNTDQQDAIKNYNEIMNNLRVAAEASGSNTLDFHPLVIGISWPSEWVLGDWSTVPAGLIRGLSFPFKKDQADDIGRRFISHILADVVLPVREKSAPDVPVVMLGHSFGARALAAMFPNWRSAFYQKTFWDTDSSYVAPQVSEFTFHRNDRLILLEGAFGVSELFDKDRQLLPSLGKTQISISMTSSSLDTAFMFAVWTDYAGAHSTFTKLCGETSGSFANHYQHQIGCAQAFQDEQWGLELCTTLPKLPQNAPPPRDDAPPPRDATVRYFDASKMINCQTPFGGGGAHDDFNRPEMARFLFSEIQPRPAN